MKWKVRDQELDLTFSARVMGILNITPDSFSDGGAFLDHEAAFRHACRMISEGADIIDVGGESSRPGSEPISIEEEIRRVIPTIERLRQKFPEIILSIDTYKAETARKAIIAGANIINDISAVRGDPEMSDVIRETKAGVILMHMQGTPKTMQLNPHYNDVIAEILNFLAERSTLLQSIGVDPQQIAIDPGFGFGKRPQDNIQLIQHLDRFSKLNHPIVVGVSRKSIIGPIMGEADLPLENRDEPTVVLSSLLRERGARILRVHNVRPNVNALRMTEAIIVQEPGSRRQEAE
jgi:dihydropteroate synthase